MMSTVSDKDDELHEDNKIFQNADSLPKQNSHVMQLSVDSSTDSSRDLPPITLSAEKSFRNIMEMMNGMNDCQDTDTSAKDVETSEMVSYPLGETSTILSSVLSSMAEMAVIDDTEFDKDKKKTCRFNTNIDTINPGGGREACTDAAELEDKEGRSLQRTNDKVNGKNEKSYDCSYQKDGGGHVNDENSKNSSSKNGMKVNICQFSHACGEQGVRNDNLFIGQTKEQSRDRRVEYCFTNCADKAPKVGENTYTCVDHCHPCIEAGGNLNMPVQPPSYCQPYVNVVPLCCPLQSHGTINTQLICNKNRYHKMHVRHTPISSAMKCTKTRRGPKRFYRHLMRLPRRKKNYGGHSLTSQCIGHRDVQPPPCSGIVKKNCDGFVCEPLRERVDIYYFDHGNSGYYRTTDRPPTTKADLVLEDTEEYVTKFWADVFGYIHIAFAFIIHFLLQLLRFLLLAIVRPLTVGAIQLGSDYFFKPLLSIAFNGVLQPVLILAYNVATSIKDLCQPLARAVGYFLRELAVVVRSLRLVEVHSYKQQRCV